jgi:DNA segregation ATPase FtsK/SpoIIIE, S-DNA-T family
VDLALPLGLLSSAPKVEGADEDGPVTATVLENLLAGVSVRGKVVQVHRGPLFTIFEFAADGPSNNTIPDLADALRTAIPAESVLIELAPERSTFNILVSRTKREVIRLRELLAADAYQHRASGLTVPIGKTVSGEPFVIDLERMPHLLVAGSTPSGKTMALRAMLVSLLFGVAADDLRVVLINPGKPELAMFGQIPHLLTPLIVDPDKAVNALRWMVREMEARYKSLAALGVRNITQYNHHVLADGGRNPTPDGQALRRLPTIVVIIDELADLMVAAGNHVERAIVTLAQMARAVGIHLIVATRQPTVSVLTGLVKVNLPARIAFRMTTKAESRAILHRNGAEQLLGDGDMLFLPPTSSRSIRVHGAYLSVEDAVRVVEYIRRGSQPVFDESVTADHDDGYWRAGAEEDALYLRNGISI